MRDKDLNLAIAEYKGVPIINYRQTDGTAGMLTEEIIPDYINNPALILELVLELLKIGFYPQEINDYYYYAREGCISLLMPGDKNFGRATALAYHKQFIGDL